MFRTIKIRLERTAELVETVSVFNQACQRVLDWGQANKQYNKVKLHRATYQGVRDSTREGGRPSVSEPNVASDEAEGREAIEAELSGKPVSLLVGS